MTLNKPILFVLYISLACAIGFIFGVSYSDFHSQDVIRKTITHQQSEVEKLFEDFGLVVSFQHRVEELEKIKSMDDLEALKLKRKQRGKTLARDPTAILAFETKVQEMAKSFE